MPVEKPDEGGESKRLWIASVNDANRRCARPAPRSMYLLRKFDVCLTARDVSGLRRTRNTLKKRQRHQKNCRAFWLPPGGNCRRKATEGARAIQRSRSLKRPCIQSERYRLPSPAGEGGPRQRWMRVAELMRYLYSQRHKMIFRFCSVTVSTRPPHPVAGLKICEKTIVNCSRNILPPEGKVKWRASLIQAARMIKNVITTNNDKLLEKSAAPEETPRTFTFPVGGRMSRSDRMRGASRIGTVAETTMSPI